MEYNKIILFERVIVKMKYEIVNDFKNNKHYYLEFLNIVKKNSSESSLTFEDWMIRSRWDDNYVPFGLTDEYGTLIAFCGVRKTVISIFDRKYSAAQLGKVYTKREHNKDEISKVLIEKINNKYENIVDLIYLFDASPNNEFLTQQGFELVPNYACTMDWDGEKSITNSGVRKINLDNQGEIANLYEEIKHASHMSRAININGDALIKTYNIMKYYPRNVFHVPSIDAIIISTIESTTFNLWGVFSKSEFDLDKLLKLVVPQHVKTVSFGFVPTHPQVKLTRDQNPKTIRNSLINAQLYIKQISVSLDKKTLKFPILAA